MVCCKTLKQKPQSHFPNNFLCVCTDYIYYIGGQVYQALCNLCKQWCHFRWAVSSPFKKSFYFSSSEWNVAVWRFWQQLEKGPRHSVPGEMVRQKINRWYKHLNQLCSEQTLVLFNIPKSLCLKEVFLCRQCREEWRNLILIGLACGKGFKTDM